MTGTNPTMLRSYPELAYGGYSRVDGLIAFYNRINALVTPESHVLDIGCGRGSYVDDETCTWRNSLRNFRGRSAQVIGIDVDPNAESNPDIDEFRLLDNPQRWPIEDASIDVAISDCVLEHVENPDLFFQECNRVMKPGGYACMRTPNRFSYISMVASVIPNRFHASVTARVQDGRKPEDVFPTYYRCNSKRAVKRTMRKAGFDVIVLRHEAEPAYLQFSKIGYRIGVLAHRLMPPPLTSILMIFAKKR